MEDKIYNISAYLFDGLDSDRNIEFYQNDTGQCGLNVTFYDGDGGEFDISTSTVMVLIDKNDGTQVFEYMTISETENNVASVVLSSQSLAAVGKNNKLTIVTYNETDRQTFGSLKFTVIKDFNGTAIESSNEVPILTTLLADVKNTNNTINTNENARISNENTRIANENTRIANETTRQNNEANRVSNESIRNFAESERIDAETERIVSETNRVSQENIRTNNEYDRVSAENERIANETSRQSYFNTVTNEISTLSGDLGTKIQTATTKKTELDTSIANAQDDINTINSTGAYSKIIYSNMWTYDNTELKYKFTIDDHILNSKDLVVSIVNNITGKSVVEDYQIVDLHTVIIFSEDTSETRVSMVARYYNNTGGQDIANEVVEARMGEASLLDNILNIDSKTSQNETDIVTINEQLAETMQYPILEGEVGVINNGYPWGDVRRYGIFPDGITNWNRDTTYVANALNNSTNLGLTLYFPSGFYKSELNINQSNVSIKVDKDVEFAGLIHIGDVGGTSDIENIKLYGKYVNYDRFGTFRVNGLYVEEIHVKSDGTKTINYPNLRSRGVHLYAGTKNFECRLITVDDADQDALNTESAVAIDGYANNPQNFRIGKIHVRKSDVHGVYITGSGHDIGEIQVDEFGLGEYKWSGLQDSNGLAQSQELKGVWLNRIENSKIGRIIVNQSLSGTRAFAKYHVMIDETGINRYGTISIGEILCDNVINASRGVCLGDRVYPCTRCIVDIKTITINGVTGVANITDYGLFNIQDNVNANISSILINNSDIKDCIKMYRNSKAVVGLIDLGDIKGQGIYCESELNLREFRCNRISSSGGLATASFKTHSHRCKIGRLILGATVAVTVKALELYSLINFQIDYLEIGQYRNTIGNIDIDTCQYTNILFLKAPGQTGKEGIGLRMNNLINCSINNGSIINYAQGITGAGYLTRCCMSNVNNAGNAVATDIPANTLQVFNCNLVQL